ncbi:hypothetical protein NKFEDGME_00143 [Salmonella phage STP-SP2]|nr:hypothetical protein NKFEDGME_00143 [Salmonella phage STP-SP2]
MASKINISIPDSNCLEDIAWSEMSFDSCVYLVTRGMYAGMYAVWDSNIGENMIFFGKGSIQVMTGDYLNQERKDGDEVHFRKTDLSLNVFFQ